MFISFLLLLAFYLFLVTFNLHNKQEPTYNLEIEHKINTSASPPYFYTLKDPTIVGNGELNQTKPLRLHYIDQQVHLNATKGIIRHVKGTTNFEIHYSKMDDVKLKGFSDSDQGSNIDDRKSTLGNCFSLFRICYMKF